MGRLGSGMQVSASFQIISRPVSRLGLGSRPVGRLGLGLGSGLHIMGRLASGILVSASFQLW